MRSNIGSRLTAATVTMLTDYGDALSLEEIQSLDSALYEYGEGDDACVEGSRAAAEAIERCLPAEVDEISSVEELDQFTDDLLRYMSQRGHSTSQAAAVIERRRDRLAEDGRFEPSRSYSDGSGWFRDTSASDDEIRSMFQGLSGP